MLILDRQRRRSASRSEPIQIVFPYATVEPLMRLLSPAGLPEAAAAAAAASKPRWNPNSTKSTCRSSPNGRD